MVVTCAVFGCLSSSRHDKERSFFHFPKDEKRCREWVRATGRPELNNKGVETLNKSYLVCDLHFSPNDRLVKKLKCIAVPSIKLPNFEDAYLTKSTQTNPLNQLKLLISSNSTSNAFYSAVKEIPSTSCAAQHTRVLTATSPPKERKLLNNLEPECLKEKCLDYYLALTSTPANKSKLSPRLQQIIDLHSKLKHYRHNSLYDTELKFFALSIYFSSPLAFRVLGKTLGLPSERTLRGMNIKTGTKINPDVLNCLTFKLKSLKESEKYCTICADIIPLQRFIYYQINTDKIIGFHEIDGIQTTEPASYAFVVMARGIFSNWEQPLGYCFLANNKYYKELDPWLDSIISNLFNIGCYVVAFVSSQRTVFLNLAKQLNVSVDKPYFFINEKKIFYIFDVSHLMISVRNNLMKFDFEFSDIDGTKLLATWKSIEILYRVDSKRAYRLATKLTESHIYPNNSEKKEVQYVTEVFNKTVAVAMNCAIELGQLGSDSYGTIKFIELFDTIFDILNSSDISDSSTYKSASGAKAYQFKTLNGLLQFLSDIIVRDKINSKDVTNSIKCLKGLKISIKSVMDLSQDLRSKGDYSLFTQRLNLDPLIFLHDSVRQQGKNNKDPTPIHFSRSFRKVFMVNLLKLSESANCASDLDQLLMSTKDVNSILNNFGNTKIINKQSSVVSVATFDYRFDLPEKNAFTYVCGYLLEKCHSIHKCEGINSYILTGNNIYTDDNKFVHCESFDPNALLSINPPDTFIHLIRTMDERLKYFFRNKIHNCVGHEILKNMKNINFDSCCPCFPIDYLKRLFVRFRIFNIIRFNNRNFRDKRKCFNVVDIM